MPENENNVKHETPACKVSTPTYIRTYIHIYIHTYIHTYVHTYIHTYIHTYTHTHIHTYTHTYTHEDTGLTHTYVCAGWVFVGLHRWKVSGSCTGDYCGLCVPSASGWHRKQTQTHMHIRMPTQECGPSIIRAYIGAYIHTHTYVRTYVHMHTLTL
jgi:hypothetical protein